VKKNLSIANPQAVEIAQSVIASLRATTTADQLSRHFEGLTFASDIRKRMQGANYPRIGFRISEADIDEMKNAGILEASSKEPFLSLSLSSGYKANGAPLTALEKLLYAVCWKNKHLGKETHILRGVLGENGDLNKGPVFYEFGRYLSGVNPFILDQHTLRVFILSLCVDDVTVNQVRELDQIKAVHSSWIAQHKQFFEELACVNTRDQDFFYLADRILFGAGSLLKTPRVRRRK